MNSLINIKRFFPSPSHDELIVSVLLHEIDAFDKSNTDLTIPFPNPFFFVRVC